MATDTIERLLADHGRTYCDEIGIDIAANTPAPLFQWLVASLLFSARVGADLAVRAARGLIAAGLTTPEHMRDAGYDARVGLLHEHGYGRYDERTSAQLGEACDLVLDEYRGDLRRLHDAAEGKAPAVSERLQAFKGIGPVGADIFCREAQAAWPSLHPFVDGKAVAVAERLGLPTTAAGLAGCVERADLPRLLAALSRVDIANEVDRYR